MIDAKEKKLAAIEAEMHSIRDAIDAMEKQRKALMDKGRSLLPKARALRLSLHVGKQVKRAIRWNHNPQLNDATGTLLVVRRAKCDVDYGDLGVWTMPVENVIPADLPQGWGAEY